MDLRSFRNTIEALCKKASNSMRNLLRKSLIPPVNPDGIISHTELKKVWSKDKVVISTDFPDYAYYVENGRRPGKNPPVKSLYDWCFRHLKRGDAKSFAFALSRKIGRKGTKPHHFLTPLDNLVETLQSTLGLEVSKEINKEISIDLDKIKK